MMYIYIFNLHKNKMEYNVPFNIGSVDIFLCNDEM